MKRPFADPDIELVPLEVADIITTSADPYGADVTGINSDLPGIGA